jgi:hypothetical protein
MAIRNDQQTVVTWDDDEQVVRVWSSSPKSWRLLEKLGLRPHRETRLPNGRPAPVGKFYKLPLARFRWGLKKRTPSAPRGRG